MISPVAPGQWRRPTILDVLLVFNLVFGMYFLGDVNTSSVIEIGLAMLWLRRPLVPSGRLTLLLLFLLFAALTYSIGIYLGNSMLDASYPLRFSRSIVAFAATLWVARYILLRRELRGDATWVYFSDILLLVLGIHAVVVFAEFTYHPFRDAIYRYWSKYPLDRLPDWRALGLTKGGALPSILQVLGFYIAWDKVARKESAFSAWVVMLTGVVSLGAVFLMAQTGVIFFTATFLPFIVFCSCRGSGRAGLSRAALFLVITIAVGGGAWWLSATRIGATLLGNLERSLITKTDVIMDFVTSGEVTNRTFHDIRENMYFLPTDLQTLLFGNSLGLREGNAADPVDRLRADTDVGYVTNIWGIGLVGLAISVGFYLAILAFASRGWILRRCPGGSGVLVVASLFFLAGHAKEVHLFARTGFEVYLFMFWPVYYALKEYGSGAGAGPSAPRVGREFYHQT